MINPFNIEAIVVCWCSSNATLAKLQSAVFLNYLGYYVLMPAYPYIVYFLHLM